MTDIMTLLTFPTSGDAFSAMQPSAVDEFQQSASPLRKVARLDTDSDSASASRVRGKPSSTVPDARNKGPVQIKLVGEPVKPRTDNASLQQLKRCIRVLLTRNSPDPLPLSYQRIFTICQYIVCIKGGGADLAGHVKMELERCVVSLRRDLLDEGSLGFNWIRPFVDACAWFEQQVNLLESVLSYLDRVYLHQEKDEKSIREVAFGQFADQIFLHSSVVVKIREGIREWIEWERHDRKPHEARGLIPQLIMHLEIHKRYQSVFESFYLELTREFYSDEAAKLCQQPTRNALHFFDHCVTRIEEEAQRSKDLLPAASWSAVRETTERALLLGQIEWLAKNGMSALMDKRDVNGLQKMYQLFSRVDGLKALVTEFRAYIQARVKVIVTDAAHDEQLVDRLLDFRAFADRARTEAFAEHAPASTSTAAPTPNTDFRYALDDAFTHGFKARRNKPAEMIAKHVDRLMRKGQRGASDEEFDAQLQGALGLYRFTEDKDVFRTFYHRALAKRLLLERSASDDFEKQMLKVLKKDYDPEFSMGDHMFNDLALSKDMMREFHDKLPEDSAGHNLNVMVLQRSFWPFAARKTDILLPPSMQDQLTLYAHFYKERHQGHKLDWDHALGTVTMKAIFKAGTKELSVSLYQAVVLLLFNETPEISFADIKESTQLEDGELRRTLQSLACGKKKVLKKRPVGKDVNDDDVFEFNDAFTDPRAKVHVNSIQVKETVEETRRTESAIEGDRKHYLDAAIVRIMKAKKQLHYEQLKTETIDAVKKHFVPEVASIKQRIQGLVEQEYLRRDEEDMNLYIYVA